MQEPCDVIQIAEDGSEDHPQFRIKWKRSVSLHWLSVSAEFFPPTHRVDCTSPAGDVGNPFRLAFHC